MKFLSHILITHDSSPREGNAEPDSDEDYEFDEEEGEAGSGESGEEDGVSRSERSIIIQQDYLFARNGTKF